MSEERTWTVTYEGNEIRLTLDEYCALRDAAHDDPLLAERLALEHLARQREATQ